MELTSRGLIFHFAARFTGCVKFVHACPASSPGERKITAVFLLACTPQDDDDCSRRGLHCEDGAKAGLALCHTVVGHWGLCQWVRLDNRLNFTLRDEIQGFVQICFRRSQRRPSRLRSSLIRGLEIGGVSARLEQAHLDAKVLDPSRQTFVEHCDRPFGGAIEADHGTATIPLDTPIFPHLVMLSE
jgi:hypothetical protein